MSETAEAITSPEAAPERASTPEARAGAARIRLERELSESQPEPAPEASSDPIPDPPPPVSEADSDGEPDNAALLKAKQVRAARLASLRAAEQERQERERARKFSESPEAKRLKELEGLEKRLTDPREIFALAQERGLTAGQLAEYLKESIETPEKLEAKRMKAEITSEIEALKAQLEEERQQRAALERSREEAEVANELIARTAAERKVAPYSARYMERVGREAFIQYAEKVAQVMPEGCGIEALHDAIESNLEQLAVIYGGESSPTKTQPIPTHAAAKAPTTITNALAATRATVGDEEAEADGPRPSLEERIQRARKRARLA